MNEQIQSLRSWMAERLLTIRALADKADVDKTTVQKILNGASEVRYSTMQAIAKALEVKPDQIKEFKEIIESKKDSRLQAANLQTAVA